MSFVTGVEDCGTIVLVTLNDRPTPVTFDHSMFRHMAEARMDEDGNVNLRGECSVEEYEGAEVLVFEKEV